MYVQLFDEIAPLKYNVSCESPINNIANIPRNVISKKWQNTDKKVFLLLTCRVRVPFRFLNR